MKKLLITLLLCLCPVAAMAAPGWDRTIEVEWEYTAPTDLIVTGFKLYQEGLPTCEWSVPIVRIGTCEVILTTKITKYTLAALFNDGNESPMSDPYLFIDWGPKPRIIRLESR